MEFTFDESLRKNTVGDVVEQHIRFGCLLLGKCQLLLNMFLLAPLESFSLFLLFALGCCSIFSFCLSLFTNHCCMLPPLLGFSLSSRPDVCPSRGNQYSSKSTSSRHCCPLSSHLF